MDVSVSSLLKDPDKGVRSKTAKQLREMSQNLEDLALRGKVVGDLITAMSDQEPSVRAEVALALGEFHDLRAFDVLSESLIDPDPKVRASAAKALGKLQDARAVDFLITKLIDPDNSVRSAVAESLGKIQDTRAVNFLASSLKDPDSEFAGRQHVH